MLKLMVYILLEPVIPFDLYGPCIAASGSPHDVRDTMIANVMALLPPPNKSVLSTICHHLHEVRFAASG